MFKFVLLISVSILITGFSWLFIGTGVTPFTNTKSLQFNGSGSNEYITFGDNLDIERTDTVSISMWVKFDNFTSSPCLFNKQKTSSPYIGPTLVFGSGSSAIFQLNNTDGSNAIDRRFTSISLSTATWYHIVTTYAGNSLATGVKFYVNGVEQSGTTSADTLSATTVNTESATIGTYGGGQLHDGNVDEVSFWSATLSSTDVNTLYNSGVPSDVSASGISGLTHWWRFGDDTDTSSTTYDRVGSVDGTLLNMDGTNISTDVP